MFEHILCQFPMVKDHLLILSGCSGVTLSICNKGLPALLEGISRLLCLKVFKEDAISASRLADFYFIYLGLDWLGILFMFTIPLLHNASNQSVMFTFNELFYCSILLHINV